jgi:hypothetical protein
VDRGERGADSVLSERDARHWHLRRREGERSGTEGDEDDSGSEVNESGALGHRYDDRSRTLALTRQHQRIGIHLRLAHARCLASWSNRDLIHMHAGH